MVWYLVAGQPNFCRDDCFASKCKAERCFTCRCASHHPMCPNTLGSSFGHITFAPLSWVLIILNKDWYVISTWPLACGWVGGWWIVVFDSQMLVEVPECFVVELFPIVRDEDYRHTKAANDTFLDEASNFSITWWWHSFFILCLTITLLLSHVLAFCLPSWGSYHRFPSSLHSLSQRFL